MVAPHYPLMRNIRALYKVLGGPGKPFMGGQLRQHLAEGVAYFRTSGYPESPMPRIGVRREVRSLPRIAMAASSQPEPSSLEVVSRLAPEILIVID